MRTAKVVGVLWILCLPGIVMGHKVETGFLDRSMVCEGKEFLYQVYVPRDFQDTSKWPVILFLHGSGERGDDSLKQTQVGLGSAIRWHPDRWPAIVVFPQAPEGESWSGLPGIVAVAALDAAVAEFNGDPSRIYLTGLSLGGRGVWQLAYHYPARFAALVPVCGFVEGNERYPDFLPESESEPYDFLARRLATIPIWIFHGEADPIVPVAGARHMVAALREVGAPVKYSELPGVGHNAWDTAYDQADLSTWLFNQKKQ